MGLEAYVVCARYYEGGEKIPLVVVPTIEKAEEVNAILRESDVYEVERWYEKVSTFGF